MNSECFAAFVYASDDPLPHVIRHTRKVSEFTFVGNISQSKRFENKLESSTQLRTQ